MGPGTTRTRRGLSAGAVSLAVLAGSLALARFGDPLLGTLASAVGIAGAPAGSGGAIASLVAPVAFTWLALRAETERGLRAVLGGLALVGASIGAGWLTGVPTTPAEAPVAIVLTYGVGLAGLVVGYLLAATDTESSGDYGTPSYVRDDPDPVTTLDGGSDDEDLQFFLDDEDE